VTGVTLANMPAAAYRVRAALTMPPNSPPLAESLRLRRFEAMQSNAELIRDHPAAAERMEEGQRMVRAAMLKQTLGRLTHAQRDRILHILRFAVEAMRPEIDSAPTEPQMHDSAQSP
jgi:hypothetical protein